MIQILPCFSRLAVVVPKFWKYVNIPDQQDPMKTLKEMQNEPSLTLAARKFCDETKVVLTRVLAKIRLEIADKADAIFFSKKNVHDR